MTFFLDPFTQYSASVLIRRYSKFLPPQACRTNSHSLIPALFSIAIYFGFAVTQAKAQPGSTNAAAYTWTTFAGVAAGGATDGVGDNAQFRSPAATVVTSNGLIYVGDGPVIRQITPAGVVSTIAGFPGVPGSVDGTNASARFGAIIGLAMDAFGNLFVTDSGNSTVREVRPSGRNWVVTTIAGTAGTRGNSDGTNGTAQFNQVWGIAVDGADNVYVVDHGAYTIKKITQAGSDWITTTISGTAGANGSQDGTNTDAGFFLPSGIAIDSATNLYVADTINRKVRKLTPSGTNWVVTTIAGSNGPAVVKDGTGTNALFAAPMGIAADQSGNLYVTDGSSVRMITGAALVTTFAGSATNAGSADGTGLSARFNNPFGICVDASGNVFVADTLNFTIRQITPAGVVSTLAGTASSAGTVDGTGAGSRFNQPAGLAVSSAGAVYVADTLNDTIRQITSAGKVRTIAGSPTNAGSADDIGNNASFNHPSGVAVDAGGQVYVADTANNVIRAITPAGSVSTLAGMAGSFGTNDGTGNAARFSAPQGIAADTNGNVYVADTGNGTIRKIAPGGMVTTIAGLGGKSGSVDGSNSVARFSSPTGVAVDNAGTLYVADRGNNMIRKVSNQGADWVTVTLAGVTGKGNQGNTDGVGTNARFNGPISIAVDSQNNLYVAESVNHVIRKMTLTGTNWAVSTIGGLPGPAGGVGITGSADGAGRAASFNTPSGIGVDAIGNVFVADTKNNTIRKGVFTAYATTNSIPFTPPVMNGQLSVILLPPEANGQWRFPWEIGWHNSGQVASNLTAGNYPVEFRAQPGWLPIPQNLSQVPVADGVPTLITNQYYPSASSADTNSGGSLTVNLGPSPPAGAGWRFLGDVTPFLASGYTTNLAPGRYLIEFAGPFSGRSSPGIIEVPITAGQPAVISVNYLLSSSPPNGVLFPFPVPPANLNDRADYPFGFNGQLESSVGYGSGVAVQANVVLTAAHLVFDDQALAYVAHTYWFFERERGEYEPTPIEARGWYVLSGYAAQRTNDLEIYAPDQSTPQSRNQDVAALYFPSPVAGGGYGGYLPSDASPNSWLTGNSLKMLVGYPVDGSLFGDASIVPGKMYQTDPQPYPLSPSTDPVADQQVYTAPWFLSYPGNSGGPLYVQFNGYYYPAGVYLGTLYNGVVPSASAIRAIDSDVVNLITLAQTQGDNGTNHTGGGVITIIPNTAVNAAHPGYIQWRLGPPAALLAGAGWRLVGDAAFSGLTNYTRAVLNTNTVAVEFKPIPGWNLPANQSISVVPDQITPYNAFYTVVNPVLVANPALGIALAGTTGTTYRIESRTSLTSGNWQPVSTNTIFSTGLNLILPPQPAANQPVTFYRAVWLP